MSNITYTTTTATMGEATDSDGEKFAAYVETNLATDFPGVEIEVRINNLLSSSQLSVSDDLDADYVGQTIQGYWDRGDWANV